MSGWTPEQAELLTAPEQIDIATRRTDGTLRGPRTIWIVGNGDRVFIRSTNGRDANWFRGALTIRAGHIQAGDRGFDVALTEASEPDVELADAGYEAKYGPLYPSIVRHLHEDGPRAATLEVHPA